MQTMTRRTALWMGAAAVSVGAAAVLTSDDPLADLFAPPPPGPAMPVMYQQGVIATFNPVTLENTVRVGGPTGPLMTNLPLLGVAEAASFTGGSVVGLQVVGSSYAIIGRFVVPNTPDALDAITQVGQSAVTDFVATLESTTSVPFTDLATVGPRVTVNVRASGKILIFLAATMSVPGIGTGTSWGAFVNVDITGANTITPASIPGGLGFTFSNGAAISSSTHSVTRMIPLTGLNPGLTTLTAKYAVFNGQPGETAFFRNRSIAVFAL